MNNVPSYGSRDICRTRFNVPRLKLRHVLARNDANSPQLSSPRAVVRGDQELSIWKGFSKKLGQIPSMSGIDRHHHIVKHSQADCVASEAFCQRQIEAESHTVLMSLTMEGQWRVPTLVMEVDLHLSVQRDRCGKRPLVRTVQSPIEVDKARFDLRIQSPEHVLTTWLEGVHEGLRSRVGSLRIQHSRPGALVFWDGSSGESCALLPGSSRRTMSLRSRHRKTAPGCKGLWTRLSNSRTGAPGSNENGRGSSSDCKYETQDSS